MITLSGGQQKVFDQVMAWHAGDKQTFALAGYAGTGKTTLSKYIAEEIDPRHTAFCAFTGKAANVLREKGCDNSATIHSWLYSLTDHDRDILRQLENDVETARRAGNFTRMDSLLVLLEEKRLQFRRPKFELNMDSLLASAPLVIVDEYSMLSGKLIDDLQKVAKKILYLGDPFQLPPIEGTCPIKAGAFLEEIHRQALESPIIRAANDVRQGRALEFCDLPGFRYQPKASIAPEEYHAVEQIIVGRNNTRTAWNRRFRALKGWDKRDGQAWAFPVAGDKMICLKNNPISDLFNGMIGYAKANARNMTEGGTGIDSRYSLDFEDKPGLPVWCGDINGEGHKYDGYRPQHRALDRFDYAYAITCHKSQGSEFDNVLIYHEPIGRGEEARRWTYTAITRGKNKVTLVEPR